VPSVEYWAPENTWHKTEACIAASCESRAMHFPTVALLPYLPGAFGLSTPKRRR